MFACGKARELLYLGGMFEGNVHGLKIAGLFAVLVARLSAGEFAAPAEGPVAFRRDRVPLDAGAMGRLSQSLSTLAEGLSAETAPERRGAAQMLALALALDPANAKARSLIDDFTKGRQVPSGGVEAGKIESCRAWIWESIGWLDTAEAGGQGQALAACLKDVIVFSDPKDSRVAALRDAGERGAWVGWIPPLAAYETKEIPATNEILPVEPVSTGPPLAAATVTTPIWKIAPDSDNEKWVLAKTDLRMSAVKKDDNGGEKNLFSLAVGSPADANAPSSLSTQIIKLLKNQHGKLPTGLQVTLSAEGLDAALHPKMRQPISAASAVLASAAVTGREVGNVTIIGNIDATGKFSLPLDFWAQLQSLGPGSDGRLVLPMAAGEYLPSMLALERQQFFMDYEVLLAGDFKELLELTVKNSGATLAKVSDQFHELCKKGANQPLGQYVANPFVRRRLAEILQEAPYHYSAKMLGIQSAGIRPTIVSRLVLAAELRRAIKPMGWIVKTSVYDLEPDEIAKFGTIYETCRVQVDGLLRNAEKGDREWVSKTQNLVTGIRVLDRAAKSRGNPGEVLSAMNTAQKNLMHSHKELDDELDREANNPKVIPVR